MARVKRDIPMHIRLARMRDVKQNLRDKKRLGTKFPNCIGKFPDCKDYKEETTIEERPECKFCPHNNVQYNLGGVERMSDEEQKTEEKPKKTTEEKVKEWMAQGWKNLGPGKKAFIRRLKNSGEIDVEIPEKSTKEKQKEKEAEKKGE